MNNVCQTYVDNLAAASKLVKPQFASDMTDAQILRAISRNAEELYRIHQENDQILKDILFSKEAGTLSSEEVGCLSELADAIFNFNRSQDTGVAYRIHKLLYAYAQYHHDTDMMIRELYYQGITLFYLNVKDNKEGVDLFTEEIGECFRGGAAYLARYDELENPQTRGFILRCLGNIKYGLKSSPGGDICRSWENYMECFSRAMEIFTSPRYRQMNPEIPWDNFVYTMHYDRTKFLGDLRDEENPVIAQAVMESAEYVYRYQEESARSRERGIGIRTRYVYAAARYHVGSATIGELLETLFELCESADIHDFSADNIWVLLNTPSYLMRYSEDLPEAEQRLLQPRLQQAIDKQKTYMFLIPRNDYGVQVSQTVHNVAGYLSSRDTQFAHQLLDYILACHAPTYVHSSVVALLTRRLCAQLIRTKPWILAGTFGFESAEDVTGNAEEILDMAYQSGLYHDLGKCMLLNNVSLYTRKLLDEEFAGIKMHPVFGYRLLNSLHMEKMAWVAYFHHRTYDGAGGYPGMPKECPDSARRIADIVTVVDSLDAGTDDVGRSYAAAKTYGQLIEELRSGKGRRYAPEIVELFDDPVFYSETEKFLHDKRRQVYLEIYSREQ